MGEMKLTVNELQAAIKNIDANLHQLNKEIRTRQEEVRRLNDDRLLCQQSINEVLAEELRDLKARQQEETQ